MKFVRLFLKTFLIPFGGFMAGCVADSQVSMDGKAELEALKAQAGVVVSLTAVEATVSADESVELVFTVENLTEDNFRVLPWQTPLEVVLSADVFDVTYNDELLPYRGRVIKRAAPGEADYLDIAAGEKKEVTVNLSQAYDTRTAGSYHVQLKTVDGEYEMHEHRLKILTDPVVIERL